MLWEAHGLGRRRACRVVQLPHRRGGAVAGARLPEGGRARRRAYDLRRAAPGPATTRRPRGAGCCSTSGPRQSRPWSRTSPARSRRPASPSTSTGPARSRRRRCCCSRPPSGSGTWQWDDIAATGSSTPSTSRGCGRSSPTSWPTRRWRQFLPATIAAVTTSGLILVGQLRPRSTCTCGREQGALDGRDPASPATCAGIEWFQLPTVTQWNRVEGRPRTAAFDRAAARRGARRAVDADPAVAAGRVPRRRRRGAGARPTCGSTTPGSPGPSSARTRPSR